MDRYYRAVTKREKLSVYYGIQILLGDSLNNFAN